MYIYIYTFFALSLCFGGRRCALPPIPPPASLFNSHLHHTSLHVCIYIYVCLFLHVALPAKTGIVLLLCGDALHPPPNPPSRFFIQVTLAIHFSACVNIYIYMFLHVALPVKTGIVILLCPPPAFIFKSHLQCTSLHVYVYIYIRFLRCHSALGGGAAPSPQSPLPLLYSSHTCITIPCMCIYIYLCLCVFLHAYSVACENRYCHSALGGRAAPLFLFRLNTYAGTCMSIEHIYMRPHRLKRYIQSNPVDTTRTGNTPRVKSVWSCLGKTPLADLE